MEMDSGTEEQPNPSFDSEVMDLLRKRGKGGKAYLIGTIMGITFGGIFCVAGFIIAILGLTGTIELVFEAGGLRSRLANACPGAFFALMGMIILWRYKPKIRDELDINPRYLLHHETCDGE
jgi:hypothetical protein